jgi:hypothetical protein
MGDRKLRASFQIVDKLTRQPLSEWVDGVIHLFEQQYDPDFIFWHGVAEAALPWSAFSRHAPEDSWVEHANVVLEDGRVGQCRIGGVKAEKGDVGDYMRIKLVGTSSLRAFDQGDPHIVPFFSR